MAKLSTKDYQDAVQDNFKDAKSISLLGSPIRRNSLTFKITQKSGPLVVIKLLKENRGAEANINDEKKSLKHLDEKPDIKVSKLLSSGELKIKTTKIPYLLFPYYEGSTVSELSSNGRKYSEKEVEEFISSLTKTILQLAEVGIIHQDIKPNNIVKQDNGDYILLDLGISRFSSLDPSLVKQQGPAVYLSMEQIELGTDHTIENTRRISFLSDLNSLGIVAVNLLLGDEFNKKWEVDKRPKAAQRIREGEIVAIKNVGLRELVAGLLETSPSTRLHKIRGLLDISAVCSEKVFNSRYWSLHKTTGLTFLEPFAKDNSKVRLGLVLSAETIRSVSNTSQLVDNLQKNGWEVVVDPSTHKLLLHETHHAFLRNRQYYYGDLVLEKFFGASFIQTFANQIIEFQRSLNPTFYISPYFSVSKHNDQLITVGFSLFEECRKQLDRLGDSKPLILGLSASKILLGDPREVDRLADQIVSNRSIDAVYLNLELQKQHNTPCKDPEYLSGVKRLVERIMLTKQVLVSQIDQASLGLLTMQNVSIAVNPNPSYRKNDIEKLKEKKNENEKGPKAKDKRYRVYIPKLLSDLDIDRDLKDQVFNTIDKKLELTNKSVSPYYQDAMDISNQEARNKHFTLEFNRQVSKFDTTSEAEAYKVLKTLIRDAKNFYDEVENAGIKLDGDQTGDFLDVWEEVFL